MTQLNRQTQSYSLAENTPGEGRRNVDDPVRESQYFNTRDSRLLCQSDNNDLQEEEEEEAEACCNYFAMNLMTLKSFKG